MVTTANKSSSMRTVIEPKKGWQLINFAELWRYRDLFYFLVWRDIKVLYAQTVLGFLWAIIRPLFSMVVFSVVFGGLAKVPSDGIPYPIFSYAALLPWTYFSTALTTSSTSLITNAQMLSKVYFPRLIIPMTAVLAKLVDFFIASSILAAMMFWFGIAPTVNIIYVPLLIVLMMLTAAGFGMWLSALGIQYRDVKHASQFISQLLMYAAPVVWPSSLIPAQYRLWYGLYPIAGVIEGFRAALLGSTPMPWDLIGMGSLSAIVIFGSGLFYFRRMERIFADVA
ncbi:MAG: ABC transporter permease [Gemmatimonadetes bacterium]|nr:MAG: ABC transporter permease [Gemmatimonadota bacterium]